MQKILICLALVSAFSFQLSAQLSCDNAAIEQLAKTNNEQQLIAAIRKAPPSCPFDLKPSAVKALKASSEHITDAVIAAMESKGAASQAQASVARAAAEPARSTDQLEKGVYLFAKSNPKEPISLQAEMAELKKGGFGKGNLVGSITGIGGNLWQKKKMRFELPGIESPVKIEDGNVSVLIKGINSVYRGKIFLVKMEEHEGNRVAATYEGRLSIDKKAPDSLGTPEWKGNDVKIAPAEPLEPGHYGVVIGEAEVYAFDIPNATQTQLSKN